SFTAPPAKQCFQFAWTRRLPFVRVTLKRAGPQPLVTDSCLPSMVMASSDAVASMSAGPMTSKRPWPQGGNFVAAAGTPVPVTRTTVAIAAGAASMRNLGARPAGGAIMGLPAVARRLVDDLLRAESSTTRGDGRSRARFVGWRHA